MWKESKDVKDFFSSPPPATVRTTQMSWSSRTPFEAPVTPEWSQVIPTPGRFDWESDGPLLIRTSDGREIHDDPKLRTEVGKTDNVQFQSGTTGTVKGAVLK